MRPEGTLKFSLHTQNWKKRLINCIIALRLSIVRPLVVDAVEQLPDLLLSTNEHLCGGHKSTEM